VTETILSFGEFAEDRGGGRRGSTTSPCYDGDFYPFGREHAFVDSCPQNYKFTGKERDGESGLDYFGARYYSSSLGRLMTPDLTASSSPMNPQSWNLYA
jgi:RHS repeat-associated protein